MLKKFYCWFHRIISPPEQRGEYSSGYWQERIRKEALTLLRDIAGRVLEVGCGEGLFLVQLAKDNPHLAIWGIDNDIVRLEEADRKSKEKNLKNINLSLQEATRLSFENEYFDSIVCINVFFNMPSFDLVRQTLNQMKRVYKKSGRLIFEFRNSLNPLLLLKYGLARYYDATVKNLPLRCYRPRQIDSLLKDLNLKVKRKIFIGSFILKRFAPIILIEAEKI
jgi:ubiquinone/menaquinone biosynthesis C-methylase UbiE